MIQYLVENSTVTHFQHGCVSKKTCSTNLLTTFEDWTAALDTGCGVDIIYLDFSKVLDTVPHLKLKGYGIGGKLMMWLTSFLHG